jgi:hypothetical protein
MIEPRYGVLQSLFADRVFRIPHYQRFYSWGNRQREDLFSDIKKLAGQKEDQHHFMATIVCHRTAETKSVGTSQYRIYDIVDGQQRMTTLIILLKCIELAMPAGSDDRNDLAKILVKRDGHLILLQTNNANEYLFNRFIREGEVPQRSEIYTHSDRNLARAIEDCQKFVGEWQQKQNIAALMSLVLHRLGFVVHDTEDNRAVYTVFEVLNSRGLDVDWLDKTKSVLMGVAFELAASPDAAAAGIQNLQSLWAEIYREIAKENVPGDEILRVTATLYYGPAAGKPRSSEDSLELLRKECNAFDKARQISERLLDVARKLVRLHGDVYLGPVTEILQCRLLAVAILCARGVNDRERQKLLQQWEGTTFRIFGLNSKDSRTKVGAYVRLAAQIMKEDIEMRTYNQIIGALRELGADYPIDSAVMEGLVGKDCYENPEKCRYILWLYEEHLARSAGAGATVDEHDRNAIWRRRASDSIEHIFPQNPNREPAWKDKMRRGRGKERPIEPNVGRIGNLLLLPIRLNQESKTRPFEEKKQIYARHHLRMIDEVCEKADWTLKQIEERETKIVEWAKTQWRDI